MLKEERLRLIEEIESLKRKQNKRNLEINKLKKEKSENEIIIEKDSHIIEKNSNFLRNLVDTKNELEKIDIKSINDEINQILYIIEGFYSKQKEILPKLSELEVERKRINHVYQKFEEEKEDNIICWVCGESSINRHEVKKHLEQIKKNLIPLSKEMNNLNANIEKNKKRIIDLQVQKQKTDELFKIKKEIDFASEKIFKLQKEIIEKKERIDYIEAKIPAIEEQIEMDAFVIEVKENELNIINSNQEI